MTISASDLLTPNGGRLSPSLFAGEEESAYLERLDVFLGTGAAAATDAGATDATLIDSVAEAWAYFSAYDEKVQSMAAQPNATTFADGEGAQSFSSDQRQLLEARAREWLDTYTERLDAAVPATAVTSEGWARVRSLRSANA